MDQDKLKSLIFAARIGSVSHLKRFIGDSNNINDAFYFDQENNNIQSPFLEAGTYGHIDCIKYFIEELNYNCNNILPNGLSSFCMAVGLFTLEIIEYLLGKGADVNKFCQDNITPLFEAAKKNDISMVKLLVENGAYINISDDSGRTPLHYSAISRKDQTSVEYLIDSGASINDKDNNGDTPVHLASKMGKVYSLCCLLKKGADVNIKNNRGETALWKASRWGLSNIVEILLNFSADFNIYQGSNSPLYIASYMGHSSCVEKLLSNISIQTANISADIREKFFLNIKDLFNLRDLLYKDKILNSKAYKNCFLSFSYNYQLISYALKKGLPTKRFIRLANASLLGFSSLLNVSKRLNHIILNGRNNYQDNQTNNSLVKLELVLPFLTSPSLNHVLNDGNSNKRKLSQISNSNLNSNNEDYIRNPDGSIGA